MDVNSFMEQSFVNQVKQNVLFEGIFDVLKDMNDNGVVIVNVEGEFVQVVIFGVVINNIVVLIDLGIIFQLVVEKQVKQEIKKVVEVLLVQEVKLVVEFEVVLLKDDKKKVIIDDVCVVLKKYVVIEGNDVVMDLLISLNVKFVSDLVEQGLDVLQKLIDKVDGKSV